MRELRGHVPGATVSSVAFSPDGQQIASGGPGGLSLVHMVRDKTVAARLTQPAGGGAATRTGS